jgi:hypothetical protein
MCYTVEPLSLFCLSYFLPPVACLQATIRPTTKTTILTARLLVQWLGLHLRNREALCSVLYGPKFHCSEYFEGYNSVLLG